MAATITACAHRSASLPIDETPHKVSSHYEAVGDSTGIRPFVYGKRTLIKLDQGKSFSPSIKDEKGATVNYKVQGGYYVLDRKLDTFTLSGSGHLVRYSLIPLEIVDIQESDSNVSDLTHDAVQDVESEREIVANKHKKISTSDPIYAIMYEQMLRQRKLLDEASRNPSYTGEELFQIHSKLDEIEYKIMEQTKGIVHVHFPFNNTVFSADKEFLDAILPIAKDAARVNLYGRTDSRIADEGNKIIASGRVMAAKEFLVNHGVPENIIRTSWRASGDFIAPARMEEGRKLNRRVTIEIIPN